MSGESLYLDLMKKVLTNSVYRDAGILYPDGRTPEEISAHREVVQFDDKRRHNGFDFPTQAHTMIGIRRLDNIHECIDSVLTDGVAGDLIETGVWRGGATIFMRAVLKAHNVTDRKVWVADSFEGLPAADVDAYPDDAAIPFDLMNDVLAVSVEAVKENFRRYDLLDEQVEFLVGYFRDTLPTAPIESLAVLRLDGDMYESTMDGLRSLYPKLSTGGYVIVDDYRLVPACRRAVSDYRDAHGIREPIRSIDACGSYWRKG